MRFDPAPIANYDLSSLKCLGTVGEPINPEAWRWYFENVGRSSCSISDTYWQTETGGHLATNLPGLHPMKPGSCAVPYYGIEFAIVDPQSGRELLGNGVEGVLCVKHAWPSIARSVYGDHERYLNVYLKPYPGKYYYGIKNNNSTKYPRMRKEKKNKEEKNFSQCRQITHVSGLVSLVMSDAKYNPRHFVYLVVNIPTPIRHDAEIVWRHVMLCSTSSYLLAKVRVICKDGY